MSDSILKPDDNLPNKIPSVEPEVIKFFQSNINENLTEEEIAFFVNSLQPKPNPISGQIINLSYLGNSDNLVEVQIDNFLGNIFTLSAECNPNSNSNTIKIINLNNFQVRLQEAFNYQFSVNVFYEDEQIFLLEIAIVPLILRNVGRPPKRPKF